MSKWFSFPQLRYDNPYWHNVIAGCILAATSGLYVALNLMGAGGGRPDSNQVTQRANAIVCSVWFLSSLFGGTFINVMGVRFVGSLGVVLYMVYVGSFYYYDQIGHPWFPYFGGVCDGLGAGMVFAVAGYISLGYSEEGERGSYISMVLNMNAVGSIIGGIIAIACDHSISSESGVPQGVYIALLIVMGCVAVLALLLRPPNKLKRDDGSAVGLPNTEGPREGVIGIWESLKDKRIWLLIPSFIPSETFLVYSGNLNFYRNDLRTRSMNSLCAVVVQVPFGWLFKYLMDNEKWSRKKRSWIGIVYVGVPTVAAWIWEIVRDSKYELSNPPKVIDFEQGAYASDFILFVWLWTACSIYQYLISYFLGLLSNDPIKGAHNTGTSKAFLAAGEAICYGLMSMGTIPYKYIAGVVFAFYVLGLIGMGVLATYYVTETNYFKEEHVVVPNHLLGKLDGISTSEGTVGSEEEETIEAPVEIKT